MPKRFAKHVAGALPAVFVVIPARYVPANGARRRPGMTRSTFPTDSRVSVGARRRWLRAAAVMGRLRNAIRAFAFEEHGPTDAVDLLNRMIHFLDPDEMATMIYGVLDPRRRELTLVNAGHLPPLICRRDEEAQFLDVEPQPPIGAVSSSRGQVSSVQLQPGSTVLLYTDGIVERRHESLDDRLEMLRKVVDCDADLDELADRDGRSRRSVNKTDADMRRLCFACQR